MPHDFSSKLPAWFLRLTLACVRLVYKDQFPKLTKLENIRFTMVAGYLQFMVEDKAREVVHG